MKTSLEKRRNRPVPLVPNGGYLDQVELAVAGELANVAVVAYVEEIEETGGVGPAAEHERAVLLVEREVGHVQTAGGADYRLRQPHNVAVGLDLQKVVLHATIRVLQLGRAEIRREFRPRFCFEIFEEKFFRRVATNPH